MARRERVNRTSPEWVDPAFSEKSVAVGDVGRHEGRPVREALSNRAGASSPFGDANLPMAPDEVGYRLPGEEREHEKTEDY